MGKTYGRYDRGELADKIMVLITVDTVEEANDIAENYPNTMCTVHRVWASHYDIDYNMHKLQFFPATEELND